MVIFHSYVSLPEGIYDPGILFLDVGMFAQLPHLQGVQGASMFYSPDPAQ